MRFLRLSLTMTNRRSIVSSYLSMSSSSRSFSALITPEEAISLYSSSSSSSGVKFVDGSWYLGGIRDPNQEYLKEHIPSSVRFDMDATCDKENTLPHMLPTAETFSKWATDSGLNNNDKVLIENIKLEINSALFPELETNLSCPALITAMATRLEKAISIDNGIMHMIGLANIPMIVLFGPTNSKKFAPKINNIEILDSKILNNSEDIETINEEDILKFI